MSNQINNEDKNGKGLLNIVIGLIIGVIAVTTYFKASDFIEEKRIEEKILQQDIEKYNNTNDKQPNQDIPDGEPTDLPPYKGNSSVTINKDGISVEINNDISQATDSGNNTWNGKELIGLEEAKTIALETVGGGDIIYQEEDIYDIEDTPTYDFKIKNGNKEYEIEIDALTGAVIDYDID